MVVTGANTGIGRGTATALYANGATVIMADINAQQGDALAADINGAEFITLDVTSEQAWIDAIADVSKRHGRIDVLLNCAGIVRLASIEETTEADWRAVNAVGTDGTFYGCKHVLPVMKAQGAGSIINMCSTASIQGAPGVFAALLYVLLFGFAASCTSPGTRSQPPPPEKQPTVRSGAPLWAGEELGWAKLNHIESWLATDAARYDPFWRVQGEMLVCEPWCWVGV